MMRMVAVLEMTLRRLMRSRLLVVSGIGVLLLVGMQASVAPTALRMSREGRTMDSADLVAGMFRMVLLELDLFGVLAALVVGGTVLRRDLIDGTIASVLSKPVSRGEYVLGSALGGVVYILLAWLMVSAVLELVFVGLHYPLGGVHYAAVAGGMITALLALTLALAGSLRFNPWLAALGALIVMRGPTLVAGLAGVLGAVGVDVPRGVVRVLGLPFPVVSSLDPLTDRLRSGSLAPRPVWPGVLHVLDYAAVMVVCTWLLFRRTEINQVRE